MAEPPPSPSEIPIIFPHKTPQSLHSSCFVIAALLCVTGTAQAQAISAFPTSLNFTAQALGAATAPQTLAIMSSGDPIPFTLGQSAGSSWLVVNPYSGTTNGSVISVAVNPARLTAGTYSARIVATATGTTNTVSIPVNLTVTQPLQASVSQTSLAFSSQPGISPSPQGLTLTTTSATPSNFSANVTVPWLSLNATSGATSPSSGAGSSFAFLVTPNPGTMVPGTYTGQVQITVPGALTGFSNNQIIVPVTLIISGPPQLTVSPTGLAFNYQVGQSAPGPQNLTVSGGVGLANYTVAVTSGNWLVVNNSTGAIPGIVNVGVNPLGLTPGNYTGSLTVSSPGAASVTVPVTLTISQSALVSATPSSVALNFQSGGAALVPQTVAIQSTGAAVPFTAQVSTTTGGPWLKVTPSTGTTPATLTITADPTGLASGNYNGFVALNLTGAGTVALTIPVTLAVKTGVALTASPSSLSFAYQTGLTNPATQTLVIGSTSDVSFLASSTTPWLTVTGGGPNTRQITVSANPAGLVPATYTGTIVVTTGAGDSPLQIPVTLIVSNSSLLTIPPTTLSFSAQLGSGGPAAQSVIVSSTTPGLPFVAGATTTDGANWLLLNPTTGTTNTNLTVTVNPANLRLGSYTGTISISSDGARNSPQTVMVALTITNPAITLSPSALGFSQTVSGPAPAAQVLNIGNPFTPLSFTTTVSTATGGNFLSVMPTSGSAPGQVSVSVNGAGLAAGIYTGTITITPTGAPAQTVQVFLVVSAAQTLAATPTSLSFNFQSGGAAAAVQSIALTATGMSSLPFSLTATSTGGNWLFATPAIGGTPASVMVSVKPDGLAQGTYTGTVTIASMGASNNVVVPVTLTVTAIPVPSLTALVNAASYVNGPVSPGEIVTLGGTGIGPATPAGLQLTSTGTVATTVSGTQVLFDEIPAPIIYVSSTQTGVVVPYRIAGRATSQVQVVSNGVNSNLLQVTLGPSAPGIFASNSAGSGQGAILNQDGSVNSVSNPSTVGQVVVIYATGEGVTTPAGSDGAVTGVDPPKPELPVSALIGGLPATVSYAGEAPGLVSGVLQVNAVVPPGAGTGNIPVSIQVGSNKSQPNITVALQ